MPLSRSPRTFKRSAEIVLGRGPVERHALARSFLQRLAIGGDGLLQPRRAALALPEDLQAQCRDCSGSWPSRAARARGSVPPAPRDRRRPPPPAAPSRSRAPRGSQRNAEIVLGHGPVERHALAGLFLQRRAIGGDRLLEPRRPALALSEVRSAMPRLFWVVAQSSGTRSRVRSFSAAR